MLGGHLGALVLNLLFYPIISRLFSDTTFAEYSIFLSLNVLLSIAGTFRLELEIPLAKSDQEAQKLSSTALINWVFSASIYGVIIWLLAPTITSLLDIRSMVLFMVIPSSFFTALFHIHSYWANRLGLFKNMSWSKIILRVVQIGTILLCYYMEVLPGFVLIIAIITSNFAAVAWLSFTQLSMFNLNVGSYYLPTLRANTKYIFKVLPTDLINIGSQYIPVWLITIWFSKSIAGQYAFALAILMIPVQLISNSVSPVFYKTFNEKSSKSMLMLFWKRLFLIGVIPCIVGVIFSAQLFDLVFGSEWVIAANIFQVLCFAYLILAISNSTAMSFLILKLESISLLLSFINCLFIVLSIWIGYQQQNIILGMACMGSFVLLETLIYNIIIYNKSSTE